MIAFSRTPNARGSCHLAVPFMTGCVSRVNGTNEKGAGPIERQAPLVLFTYAPKRSVRSGRQRAPGLPPKQDDDKQNCVDHQQRERD